MVEFAGVGVVVFCDDEGEDFFEGDAEADEVGDADVGEAADLEDAVGVADA